MIFYLKPPPVIIGLMKFNDASFSRLKFFMNTSDPENFNDSFPECLTPGTKLDGVGHFILRCFCFYNPTVYDFIMKKESQLFQYRLDQYSGNAYLLKDACKILLKDIRSFKNYTEPHPISKIKEESHFGSMLLSTLKCICDFLIQDNISDHFRSECKDGCHALEMEIPFQMCTSLVSSRSIEIYDGFGTVPCSLWRRLLVELFNQHFQFGLSIIQRKLQFDTHFDERWFNLFKNLSSLYQSYISYKSFPTNRISAKMVDYEKKYFPPCMSHLLSVLRNQHRLSYSWRFRFSLFLKDIGLRVDDSIEFWKTEYLKSCSSFANCQHSWKENEKKYRYSIRHMYGLEGRREKMRSKTCCSLQKMTLGLRDEGGCPFVHFDESHLLETLDDSVIEDSDLTKKILNLRDANKPNEACQFHMSSAIAAKKLYVTPQNVSIEYESPLEYYLQFKSCIQGPLDW